MSKALKNKAADYHDRHPLQILLLVALFNFVYYTAVNGQDPSDHLGCATVSSDSDWLSQHLQQVDHSRNVEDPIYLPIVFHTLGTDAGEGHYNLLKIFESMCRLNADFEPYDIQFYQVGDVNRVNRSRYYDHDNLGDADRMMDIYNKSQAINVYITNSAPDNACGYWLPSPDGIVVIKNCMGATGHTLTHEIGHFLALRHPFHGWEGKTYDPSNAAPLFHSIFGKDTMFVETVAGKNCDHAADLICDTGPDYLSLNLWECDGSLQSLQKQIDPFGTDFKSDATNYMSYSTDRCQRGFTPMQVDVMQTYTRTQKSSLLNRTEVQPVVSTDPLSNMSPRLGEQVLHQSIELSWDAHPNASRYLVQISRFNFFGVIDYEFVSGSNRINIGDLPVDKKYFWRVLPYNSFDHCGTFTTAEGGFETVIPTQIHNLIEGNQVSIFPTLISGDDAEVFVEFAFDSDSEVRIRLIDLTGRIIQERDLSNPKFETLPFSLAQLPIGPYFLQLDSNHGSITQPLFKQ